MKSKLDTHPGSYIFKPSNLREYSDCGQADRRVLRDVQYPQLNFLEETPLEEAKATSGVRFIPVNVVDREERYVPIALDNESSPLRFVPDMAATVNHRNPEEDIAAIAKQISDHAEAIYQNWKSRGLAPTEILSCNNVSPEKFTTLTVKKHVDILNSSPNNLEQLVNNFVVEDKARIARQKSSPSLSSIQYAKQKFEKDPSENVLRIYPKSPTYPTTRSPGISHYTETIESTFPPDSPGLQTWPLKNRSVGNEAVRNKATDRYGTVNVNPVKNEYIEEVAKEEERLINALKSGMVIEEPEKPGILQKKVLKERPMGIVKKVVKSYQEQAERHAVDYTQSGKKIVRSRREGGVPHPEAHKGRVTPNPVRPFLTRGSVAERVLIFEKCPAELGLDKRKPGPMNYSRESIQSQKPGPPPHTTLQRHTKAHKSLLLPRRSYWDADTDFDDLKEKGEIGLKEFYFPHGKVVNQAERHLVQEAIRTVFLSLPNQQATLEKFGAVTKACGCPLYWKAPLFIACGGEKLGYVELNMVLDYWRELSATYHDPSSKFLKILSRGQARDFLLPEDFMPLVQDVVDTHPGLTFLKEAVEFHSRYVHTVISRIYYCVNSSWTGRITLQELRRSNLLPVISLLEKEEDINQVTQYFSYEHFYVIYCKFWELDRDHDLFIDKHDLARHSDHALSTRLIDRIFSGAVTRGKQSKDPEKQSKMSYTEFVWFLLAEEDKSHPRAIEYWFRCMDLDGDGYLSMYELEYFYDEQLQRMEAIGIECLPFEDCLCQMLDMIRPEIPGKISLSDLKKCKMTPIFFDTFFNLEKYLDHEQRDPFASQRDHENEMSDWDRYAAEEYELLVAEEGGTDGQEPLIYGYSIEEDILSPNLDEMLNGGTYINNNSKLFWHQPNVTVTAYDDFNDSEDYADSDSPIYD